MSKDLIIILLIISTVTTTLTSAQFIGTISNIEKDSVELLDVVTPNQCDGVGQFLSLDVSDCIQFPCTINETTIFTLVLIPRNTSSSAFAKYTITPKSGSPSTGNINGTVLLIGGFHVVLEITFGPIFDEEEQDLTIQLEIINDNNEPEICISGAFNPSYEETTTPSDLETTPSDLETTPSDLETSPSDLETTPSDLETPPTSPATKPPSSNAETIFASFIVLTISLLLVVLYN